MEIVPKPGPGDNLGLCANFRNSNDRTQLIKHPILLIDDILSSLGTVGKFIK